MKLLIVTIDDFPHQGGKSSHISSLISGFKKMNVEYDVFSGNYINANNFKMLKLLVYPIKIFSLKKYLYLRKKIQLYLFRKELKKYIKNKEYDTISFQDAITCGYCGDLFDKSFLTMHTYFGIEYTLDNSGFTLNDKLYKKLLNQELKSLLYVKSIICVDDRIKKHVEEIVKKENKKIKVFEISNFTDTEIFKPNLKQNEFYNIGCIRRLVEKNGVIYAVKAMKYLKNCNCILNIYGEGPCMEEINAYIENNKLNDIVKLHGGVDNSKISEIYKECDVVLVPSITVNGLQEATSISAIESMACGIPTIASNIGGLKMLIKDGITGFLVNEKEPKQIAEKIKLLMKNNDTYKKISENCRNFIIENHSHLSAAKDYYNIFKGDINEKSSNNDLS